MKKLSLVLLSLVFLLAPAWAWADNDALGITISNDVLRLAPEIIITEPVSRDLLALGGNITIDQNVAKDVLALGGTVIIKGDVAGDVRAAGGTIIIAGKVGGNVSIAGGNVSFGPESSVAGSVAIAGGEVQLDGNIEGDVVARTGTLAVAGAIGGNLDYRAEKESQISPDQVRGTVTFKPVEARGRNTFNHFYSFFGLISLFGALVVGLIFVSLLPRTMRSVIAQSIKKPAPDWLRGLIVLLASPLLIIFLLFTLIGIPVALVLLVAYLFAIYMAKVITGLILGTYVVGVFKGRAKAAQFSLLGLMVIGVVCLWIVGSVPVVGWLIKLAAIIWGLGILVRLKWQIWQKVEGR